MENRSKDLWRRSDVIAFLGITKHEVTKLIQVGKLNPFSLRKGGRSYFLRMEVESLKRAKN